MNKVLRSVLSLSLLSFALGFSGCAKEEGSSSAASSTSAPAVQGDSSIVFSGPADISYPDATARLFKPNQVWYLVIRGSEGMKNYVAATLALKPGFFPEVGSYAVEGFPGIDRPDIFGTIEYAEDREKSAQTGMAFSEETNGTIVFDSVGDSISGTYEFSSKDESGATATVSGAFKVDRPADYAPAP